MSWTPAASRIGRTAPPAMTPVPWTAGFRKTRPAPKWPVISHGIVVSLSGTKIRSFFACSTAFGIAPGTSWACPRPRPTWPRPSPTTTSAVNENRRPPLTTLATRLIDTTRSVSSSTLGSIFASATQILLDLRLASGGPAYGTADALRRALPLLKNEPAGAGRVGERLHPPVVLVAAAIEHYPLDPAALGVLREERADHLRRGDVAAGTVLDPERRAPAVHREDRPTRVVIDELRVDVVEAPEHREAGSRRGPAHVAPDPAVSEVARHPPLLYDHFAPAPAFLPTLRRTTSSAYLMPLPLYGSGLRNMRSFAAVCPSSALSAPRSVTSVCLSISAVMPSGRGKITGCE